MLTTLTIQLRHLNWSRLFLNGCSKHFFFLLPLQCCYPRLLGHLHTYQSLGFWLTSQSCSCNSWNVSLMYLFSKIKIDCVKRSTNLVNLGYSRNIWLVTINSLTTQYISFTLSNVHLPKGKSPHSKIGLNLDLPRISQIKFCFGDPITRHFFNDTFLEQFFSAALYRMCSFAICTVSFTSPLCEIWYSLFYHWIFSSTFSTIPFSCRSLFILLSVLNWALRFRFYNKLFNWPSPLDVFALKGRIILFPK